MVVILVESRRKHKQEVKKQKHLKPVRWYFIRWVFWMLLLGLCFVMFMMGWYVGTAF